MNLQTIGDTILNEASAPEDLTAALDAFVLQCSTITGIEPDPSFSAWADDSMLPDGVAINPGAAAQCALDYQRSVIFIRSVNAAISCLKSRFPNTTLEILYAGCGPFATLMLPLLGQHLASDFRLSLLDFHQRALDSVRLLLAHFNFGEYLIETVKDDACCYQHPRKLHLVVAETMQKSLEQEPQFAVTANLAAQLLPEGIFIPQCIEVDFCLLPSAQARDAKPYLITRVFTLKPAHACSQMQQALVAPADVRGQIQPTTITIPSVTGMAQFAALLRTQITVFDAHRLNNREAQITLPQVCRDVLPLTGGEQWRVSYRLGQYPRFNFERLDDI